MTPAPATKPFHFAPGEVRPDDPFYEPATAATEAAVDLRAAACGFPPIYDQGPLNSCTANAVAAVLGFDMRRQKMDPGFEPSRLFIYYNERYLESTLGTPRYGNHGAPALMRDCIAAVDTRGVCAEAEWPYAPSRLDTAPPPGAFASGSHHRGCDSFRLRQDVATLKAALAEGNPFVCGIVIHAGFVSPHTVQTGAVPLPAEGEAMLGGHAIAVVGYDDAAQVFLFRNSFGASWGDHGHGRIPYAYLADPRLAVDFWLVRRIVTEDSKSGDQSMGTAASQNLGAFTGTPAPSTTISPALSQKLALAAASPAISSVAYAEAGDTYVFDDGAAIYGLSSSCVVQWTVKAQQQLHGWALNGSDLYVQDGCVVLQFDIDALQRKDTALPESGVNLATHFVWSRQMPGADKDLAKLMKPGPDPSAYGAPLIWNTGSDVTVFACSAAGNIYTLAYNLVPDQSRFYYPQGAPADAPAAVFPLAADSGLTLEYLSNGQVVTVNAAGKLAEVSAAAPPVAAEQWRAFSAFSAAAQGGAEPQSPQAAISLVEGMQTLYVVTPTDGDAWQLLALADQGTPASAVALQRMNNGSLTGVCCRLAGGTTIVGRPFVRGANGPNPLLFAVTRTAAGEYRFEQYKLVAAPPMPAAPSGWAWRVLSSQLQAIGPCLSAGGTAPFDGNSQVVCFAAALQSLASENAGVAAALPGAASSAAHNILSLAQTQGAPLAPFVADLVAAGVTAGDIYSRLKALGIAQDQTVRMLHTAGVGSAAIYAALLNDNCQPKDAVALLRTVAGTPAAEAYGVLTGTGQSQPQALAILLAGGYAGWDAINAAVPQIPWNTPQWYFDPNGGPSQRVWDLAATLVASGMSMQDIANALVNHAAPDSAAAVLQSGFQNAAPEDVGRALVAAGYNHGMALWAIADIYGQQVIF